MDGTTGRACKPRFPLAAVASVSLTFLLVDPGALLAGSPWAPAARQAAAAWAIEEDGLEKRRSSETPRAARLVEPREIEPLATLAPAFVAELEQLEQLAAHNLAGRLPTRVGIQRELPETIVVELSRQLVERGLPRRHAGGRLDVFAERLVWAARIDVEGAFAFRVQVEASELPDTAQIWVYHDEGSARGPVGTRQQVDGRIWSPTLFASSGILEIDVPLGDLPEGKTLVLLVRRVGEIFRLDDQGAPLLGPQLEPRSSHCLVDAMCKDSEDLSIIEDFKKAVANLIFPVFGGFATCSGGLISTTFGPESLLLTANHCFGSPESAAGLDAYWDHVTDTCNGADPGLAGVPSTSGSTVLASSKDTDFTLVQIEDTLPANRYFLGWRTGSLDHGTTLHRLHHPGTDPLHYSRSTVDHTGPINCITRPRPHYLYSQLVEGAEKGGSSGSPLVIEAGGGQVVGQLRGLCGHDIGDVCNYVDNRTVDGAFELTHFTTREWLDPDQAASHDVVFPLAAFTLSGDEDAVRAFFCEEADAGEVIAFSFRGTASGLSPGGSLATDLMLELAGPSGSSFLVGGRFPVPPAEWAFQAWSELDGAYVSSHITVLDSGSDGSTSCEGTWSATFTNTWPDSGAVSWSNVSIVLHKVGEEENGGALCALDEHLVLPGQTVTDTQFFAACRTITAGSDDFVVAPTGDVTFRAGEMIILESGFSVASGGRFVAEIDPSLRP